MSLKTNNSEEAKVKHVSVGFTITEKLKLHFIYFAISFNINFRINNGKQTVIFKLHLFISHM